MFERSLDEGGVTFRSIEFSSGTSLQRCLQRGLGVTICPEIAVSQELRKGSLKLLETKDIVSETPVVMIWHIDKWCSALLQLFINLVTKTMR